MEKSNKNWIRYRVNCKNEQETTKSTKLGHMLMKVEARPGLRSREWQMSQICHNQDWCSEDNYILRIITKPRDTAAKWANCRCSSQSRQTETRKIQQQREIKRPKSNPIRSYTAVTAGSKKITFTVEATEAIKQFTVILEKLDTE